MKQKILADNVRDAAKRLAGMTWRETLFWYAAAEPEELFNDAGERARDVLGDDYGKDPD